MGMGGEGSIVGMGAVALPAGYGCEPNARIIAAQKARRAARLAQVHRGAKSAPQDDTIGLSYFIDSGGCTSLALHGGDRGAGI